MIEVSNNVTPSQYFLQHGCKLVPGTTSNTFTFKLLCLEKFLFVMIKAMRPRLIILNGPLGIGKSTLAKRYAQEHPLTLFLDIDEVWAMLSGWREEKEESAPLSKQMAIEMARINLNAGYDVVIPQILQTAELADNFMELAKTCSANYYEVLLLVTKEESIKRFIARSKSQGHPTGFREGGIIATTGREEKLAKMYDAMMEVASSRSHTIKIEPELGDIEGTYSELLHSIGRK